MSKSTVTPAKVAKQHPIKANKSVLSFDRRDGRQLALALTPGDAAVTAAASSPPEPLPPTPAQPEPKPTEQETGA